jgi:hypothetical protein
MSQIMSTWIQTKLQTCKNNSERESAAHFKNFFLFTNVARNRSENFFWKGNSSTGWKFVLVDSDSLLT